MAFKSIKMLLTVFLMLSMSVHAIPRVEVAAGDVSLNAQYNSSSIHSAMGNATHHHLQQRSIAPPALCFFRNDFEPANAYRIVDGINYLNSLHKQCERGPRGCVRVSCSYDSGIFLCNDNDYPISIPCTQVADYVTAITYIPGCVEWQGSIRAPGIAAQMFDTDHWNVVVRADKC